MITRRLVASLTVLLSIAAAGGPAFAECAGWSTAAADRHACCAHRGELASSVTVTDCCAMSEQSNGAATTETQLPQAPMKLLPVNAASLPATTSWHADTFVPACAARQPALVPIYLLQVSLLI